MKRLDFNNIGTEKIIINIKCEKCGNYTETREFKLPILGDIDIESIDDVIKKEYTHTCSCKKKYYISIFLGTTESYCIIDGEGCQLDDVSLIEIPDIRFDENSAPIDSTEDFDRIHMLIENSEHFYNEHQVYLYNLLLVNLVTTMDTFIKVYGCAMVLSEQYYIEKFLEVYHKEGNSDTMTYQEKKNEVKRYFQRESFYDIAAQKRLLHEVLGIDFSYNPKIRQYTKLRDILIHRNGYDVRGFFHKLTKDSIIQAWCIIKHHVFYELYVKMRNKQVDHIVCRNLGCLNQHRDEE